MTSEAITAECVIEALPKILEARPELRYKFYAVIEEKFPSREETNRILEELKIMREESNKRFEAVDKRFEAVDKRFESMDRRFDALHEEIMSIKSNVIRIETDVDEIKVDLKDIKKSQTEIDVNLLPFMRRGGYHFEEVVRGVIERTLKIKNGKIEHPVIKINAEEIEFDAYVHNGEKILFEIKSHLKRRDVSYFINSIKQIELKFGKVRPVMIGFEIDEEALKYCTKKGIEVINPNLGVVKKREL